MGQLNISIEGKPGSGKTETAQIIIDVLKKAGYYNVKYYDDDRMFEDFASELLPEGKIPINVVLETKLPTVVDDTITAILYG